jgi:iron complex outermembrane recepter protein
MKLVRLVASFALILLVVPLSLQAQDGSIRGRVVDMGGTALAGATVSIGALSMGTLTAANGTFNLGSVPAGTHTVVVQLIGFTDLTQDITVAAGQTVTVTLSLQESALMMGELVVTGTRSAPRSVMRSPTPIDVLPAIQLQRQGNGDMTEVLKNLVPSFAATALTGDGAAFVRSTSLRGLPPDNVLVLINSKRRHRSALIAHFGAAMNVGAHAVDIGQIPTIGLKRLEVLRDGAAAQYGSDAIAGVMNFILSDAREGVRVEAQTGAWYEGEVDTKVAANIGLPLTDDGFINLSAEFTNSPELSRGIQHAAAIGVPGAKNPAMNWGRPKSSGLRTTWNAGIKLSDKAEAYAFGNYANTYGNYSFFYRAPGKSGALTPIPLNPANPAEGNFCWCDQFPAGFTPRLEGDGEDFSGILGIRGENDKGVKYDLSVSHGTNRLNYTLLGSLNLSWGPNSPFDFNIGDLKQKETNVNLDFSYPASDVFNFAWGVEWREEVYQMFLGQKEAWLPGPWAKVNQLTNPETGEKYGAPGLAANGMPGTNPAAAGIFDRQNWAAYVDTEWDATEKLLIQIAGRAENFSDFGSTVNGKLAFRLSASERFALRGGVSTGFRAPTPGQSNFTGIVTSFDGVTGKQVQEGTVRPTSPLALALGGAPLKPEDAVNLSLGFTASPARGFNITVDAYQIDVDNRIIKSRSLPVTGNPEFAELAFYTNSLDTRTKGVDIVGEYSSPWGDGNTTQVSVAYNYNDTNVLRQRKVGGINPVSDGTIFNIENNLAKHRATLTLTEGFGEKVSWTVRGNYYGSTIDERGTQEVVGSEVLVDMELSYEVNENFSLVAGANNLFNNFPDRIDTRLSQGMPFPRRSPISYHGGMSYFRIVYHFK